MLITGASGSGKSALALALMARGAALVADDRVRLYASGQRLIAECPEPISGRIEARGIGLIRVVPAQACPLSVHVCLETSPRSRLPASRTWCYAGIALPSLAGQGVTGLADVLWLWLSGAAQLDCLEEESS